VATNSPIGDHLHTVAYCEGRIEPTVGFDYGSLDPEQPEDMVSFSDMGAAFSLILQWACGKLKRSSDPIVSAGARINALFYLIDPVNSRFENMSDIAAAAGMSRAGVSKALLELRDQVEDVLPIRSMLARESYRRTQEAALKAGVHSSQRRKAQADAS
jgi:hypothetical protein